MARSGWVAVLITALLVGGLGSPGADHAAAKAHDDVRPLASSVTAFPRWSTESFAHNSDMVGPIVLKILMLLACVFLCAGLAGRVGPSMASFLGGWAAVVLSAALAGAVFNLAAELFVFDNHDQLLGQTTRSVNSGALFGLYTGWLVGASVAITARHARLEPRWVPPVPMPGAPPSPADGPVQGYPAYPQGPVPALPSGDWPGLTAPAAPTAVTPGLPGPPVYAPVGDFEAPGAPPVEPEPPMPEDPDATATDAQATDDPTSPQWSSAWRGTPSGGAYRGQRDTQRPSWTRWSGNDDDG